jgi:hypothetical protein
MPIVSARYTLSNTTPTKVVAGSTQPQIVQLHNGNKSNNHFVIIGGNNVTISNGYHLDSAESIQIPISSGDDLYAVSDPAGTELHVLAVTQD